MQDSINEDKEEEKAPTKKVRIRDDGVEEIEGPSGLVEEPSGMEDENTETLDSTTRDDNTEAMDEVMSLGSMIFQISQQRPSDRKHGLKESEIRTKR